MKTIQEYMNDPLLLNNPGMAEALEPVREIHAARLTNLLRACNKNVPLVKYSIDQDQKREREIPPPAFSEEKTSPLSSVLHITRYGLF
ncbi:MAG: hypothetical protein LBQ88_07315 [Treponema sp.]|jgi:hypothetical protein|nr:hypothetical protein [Treponema sp.]